MELHAILSALADSGANPAIRNIAKALTTVGAGTNLSALTGGGALRAENLDPVLAAVSVENQHFKFFNMLLPGKRDSFSMLDQAVVKKAIGGFPGSAIATETGVGQVERAGDYQRLVTELGVFSTRRSVSLVTAFQGALQAQQGVVDFSAAEEEDVNAALEILVTLEDSLFYGNKAADATQINGLLTSIQNAGSTSNVVDMAGAALGGHSPITNLASKITSAGKWGQPNELFCGPLVKSELDNTLISGYRLNLDNGVPNTEVGVPVKAMRYSSVGIADGLLNINNSAFITEDKVPVEVNYPTAPTLTAPATVTAAAAAAAGSKFLAAHAGSYFYRVEEWAPGKVSPTTVLTNVGVPTAVAVVAGNKVTLTITQGSATGTYYKIYRGRKGGSSAANDMRLIAVVAKTAGVQTFDDFNAVIPGTSELFLVENKPAVLRWLQMLPLTKVPFAMTDFNYPWGAILLGALRVTAPQKVGAIINILPTAKTWDPFN